MKPGWINRQFARIARDAESLPDWMRRRDMGLITRTDTMQARLAEAEARIERLEQENARLREAGARLVAHIRGGDHYLSIRRDTYSMALDEDCRVFEEGR